MKSNWKLPLELTWKEVIWVIFLSAICMLFFLVTDDVWIFNLFIIPVILIGYNKTNQLIHPWRKLLTCLALAVIITYGLRIGWAVYKSILQPPQWDFHLYWIYGQVGSRLLNPFDPDILFRFAQPLNPNEGFLKELYFFQFPALIFLFLPLGWFDINTAAFIWYVFLLAVLILDIILLWSIFYESKDYMSLSFVTLCVLVLGATFETLLRAQINFLVLLAFLLYWKRRESLAGGVWLGLGMIVKPILILALIYPALRGHWRTFLGVALGTLVASGITIIAFGPEMFFGYFTHNPILLKMPDYLYTERVNQSFLAIILRLTNFDFSNTSPYLQPWFILTAALLTGITGFLVLYRKDEVKVYSGYALALTITFALLLFPKTLTHYAVLLIVPILMIWENHRAAEINSWFALGFIAAVFELVSLGGDLIFVSILITWLFIVGICTKLLMLRPKKNIGS